MGSFKFPDWGADRDFGGLVDAFDRLRLGRFGIGCGGLNGFFLEEKIPTSRSQSPQD